VVYIDIGNTFVKIASHTGDMTGNVLDSGQSADMDEWYVHLRARHGKLDDIITILNSEVLAAMPVLACSVVPSVRTRLEQALPDRIYFIDRSMIPAALLDYETPDTLGMDRFIACYGAWDRSGRNTDVVVVDAGTATTLDLMSADGVFRGGVIAPGLQVMEYGFARLAPALPEVPRTIPSHWPPKSTTQALKWGITGSYLGLIRAHLTHYQHEYPKLKLWITGGDAQILTQMRGLSMHYHPNLVFEGLRAWKQTYIDART